jgi:hypothetical protein
MKALFCETFPPARKLAQTSLVLCCRSALSMPTRARHDGPPIATAAGGFAAPVRRSDTRIGRLVEKEDLLASAPGV